MTAKAIAEKINYSTPTTLEIEKMIKQYANEKVKEVVKEIQSQAKDSPIKENWIGFNAYL